MLNTGRKKKKSLNGKEYKINEGKAIRTIQRKTHKNNANK